MRLGSAHTLMTQACPLMLSHGWVTRHVPLTNQPVPVVEGVNVLVDTVM